jgi:hypothetical protein
MRFKILVNIYILDINSFLSFHFSFFFFFFIYTIMTGKIHTVGTRAQVWHGTSKKTSGGLTKSDLMMNKSGRIVSRSKHFSAKKEQRLLKNGYGTQKGKFGFVKIGSKKRGKGSKKMRGGMLSLSPGDIDGQDITNYGSSGSVGVQLAAGMAGGRRRRSRRMRGGSGMASLSSHGNANWSGDGIAGQGITVGNAGSANIQLLAGMAGGKRRRRRMRGGTGNRGHLGSDALQIQAGNAN